MRGAFLALALWAASGQPSDEECQAEPSKLGCGLVQSSPVTMLFYDATGCKGPPAGNTTLGSRIYSARRIYSTSNEQALCYSVSGMPGLEGPVQSIRWSCDHNGAEILQTPFATENCTGEELLDKQKKAQRLRWSSGLWSQVLDGRVCVTHNGPWPPARGKISLRLAGSMAPSARPLCAQNWQAMEGEILALTADEASQGSELAAEEQRFRTRLRAVEEAKTTAELGRQRDRIIGFGLGAVLGAVLGAAVALMASARCRGRRRATPQDRSDGRELSDSMLSARHGEENAISEFAELRG